MAQKHPAHRVLVTAILVLTLILVTFVLYWIEKNEERYLAHDGASMFNITNETAAASSVCSSIGLQSYKGRRRTSPRKVYDLIIFGRELDILEIRLDTMDSEVDFFVIVESEVTFSGQPKPLYLLDHWQRYGRWHHKIIRHTVKWEDRSSWTTWDREHYIRNAMMSQVFPNLVDAQAPFIDDVLLVSDVDEILRQETIRTLRDCDIPQRVRMVSDMMYYSFQWQLDPWSHPDATTWQGLEKTIHPQALRDDSAEPSVNLMNAGWHCSYFFKTLEEVLWKIAAFSHAELVTQENMNVESILQHYRRGTDLFGRSTSPFKRRDDDDIPSLVHSDGRFRYMLDRDSENGNFADYDSYKSGELQRLSDKLLAERKDMMQHGLGLP